jgi:hypothetical protein
MRSFRIPVSVAVAALALACKPAETPGTVYGEQPTLTDTTLISAILTEPESYVGQRVLVAGTVVEVCEKRGCWMQIAGDQEFQTLRVKVEDGVIVFPMTARGHQAVVEGIVEKIVMSAEEAREAARHHAEEQGLPFDSTATFEPTTTYQLRGIGAVVAD